MRITRKDLQQLAERLGFEVQGFSPYSINLLVPNAFNPNGRDLVFSGSQKECYAFLKGVEFTHKKER